MVIKMLEASDWDNVKLLPGFCLIEPKSYASSSSIILPDAAQRTQGYGYVVTANGQGLGFDEGDWVVYDRCRANDLLTDDKIDLSIVRHEDVMCVL
jgi:co-chaperonin GroES (HSP10)